MWAFEEIIRLILLSLLIFSDERPREVDSLVQNHTAQIIGRDGSRTL